jgi:hypothetical protein
MPGSRRVLTVVIAAALGGTLAAPAAAQVSKSCLGTPTLCEATISMAGGASNKQITVRLPGTNLRLLSVNATPGFVQGAYRLSRRRFSQGGSVFTATLDAVQGMPRNARLTLMFGHPSTGLSCGSIPRGVSFVTIAQIVPGGSGSFGCSVAKAVGRTWLARFKAHRSVRSFSASGIRWSCRLVPVVPQNQECIGGNFVVRFAGPTGI